MVKTIDINGRKVGNDNPPLVIAEIGINHEGSLKTAYEMVDAAERSGVEVIKHQTHIVEDEMSYEAKKVIPGNAKESIYEIMERCSLNEENEFKLKEYVESKDITFISTPFSRKAVDRLEKFNVPAYKVGSGELNNYPLLDYIANMGKPIILSTGMNSIDEVKKAVDCIKNHSVPYALMHTTNLYPTPPQLVRLGAMQELKKNFSDVPVGLSDHTENNLACLAAVAQGANLLERHFTDYKNRTGPDIICSMDEKECNELIVGSNTIFQMLGGRKVPASEEKVTADFAFATVVALRDIQKGEELSKDNIWVKRPGTGEVSAERFNFILGKKVKNFISKDCHLKNSDIEQ